MSETDRGSRTTPALPSYHIPPSVSTKVDEEVARDFSAKLAWRAVRRHWWQALLIWLAGSTGLMTLAYYKIKPTYDVFSIIKVDPGDRGLFRENNSMVDFEVFKETQVKGVTSPNVIATALAAHPDLLQIPRLALAQDPEIEIRRSLTVMIISRTNLIQVSMSSESADEAARIVNAVIEAYLKVALDAGEEEAEKRCRRLREVKQERTVSVQQKRDAIASLVKRIGTVDSNQARDRNSVTIEQYSVLTHQLLQTDLELVEAQGLLDQLQGESTGPPSTRPDGARCRDDRRVLRHPPGGRGPRPARQGPRRPGPGRADRPEPGRPGQDRRACRSWTTDQRQIDALWTKMKPARASRAGATRAGELHSAAIRRCASQPEVLTGFSATLRKRPRLGGSSTSGRRNRLRSRRAGGSEFARQDLEPGRGRARHFVARRPRRTRSSSEAQGPGRRVPPKEFKAKASSSPYA